MALISKRVSDVTGVEAEESAFAQVTVREHPKADQPKRLDVLPAELETLKSLSDVVILEVRTPEGNNHDIYARYTDFAKWCADDNVQKAPGIRGRQPGFSPKNGNGN